ncbi:DNA polymerase-3 subunit beta [Amycolatopsis bartoniae]|uniref:DNA polymerase III subunit beta n=1 Tax=Amycolatopsis bartoniae TaxID=941986 RepID=UPI0011947547|nr:DNA polymerase III subunit beta [Amycolatopsis bartoniae]MBB2938969.1 DNA polymerase-3 subunit beta [Amycolatopsis bartoniae]TVT11230.1 DNA polymerase III subunit beta [Amycolatopsis bartoniae]
MDLTAPAAVLANATTEATRLLPGPALGGVLLTATGDGLALAVTDREHGLRLSRAALVHEDGEVLVALRPLAETVRALDAGQVRLTVEGSRLALRAPGARFGLPLLDRELHPGVPEPPPAAGSVPGSALRAAVEAVASAASREDALPIFTGLRLWTGDGTLTLLATDRYRMAMATLAWSGERLDLLAPAGVLSGLARRLGEGPVALGADSDRLGLRWDRDWLGTALLAVPFPDERARQLMRVEPSGVVELEADALAAAVRRATPFAGPRGTVTLSAWDGELRVHSSDPHGGESEQSVKASVSGAHGGFVYQARYLLDALRPFGGGSVRIEQQEGLRPTVFTGGPGEGVTLTYLVVPMRA